MMGAAERENGRTGERAWSLLLLLTLLPLLTPTTNGQPRVVELINADSVAVEVVGGETVRRLLGRVVLRQDTTTLRADRAVQYVERGEIVLDDSVRIVTGRDTLTAHRVTYDSDANVARAEGDVRIADGETVLLAPSARYLTRTEQSFFEAGGRLLHDGATLTAPRGAYDGRTQIAVFEGPVELRDSTAVLTSARGTYDAEARRADFAGAVRLRQRGVRLAADSLTHFRETERSLARGHVVLERLGGPEDDPDPGSSPGQAPGEAPDSTRRTLLFGARAAHDEQAGTSHVEGTPERDPLLVQLRTDSTGVTDTTLVRARRLDALRRDTLGEAITEVVAVGDVRLAQPRFAAVADSAVFRRTEPADSAAGPALPIRDRLELYGDTRPLVWADEAQIAGDTLVAFAVGESLDRLEVWGSAFAAQLDTTLGRVRQIQGRRMVARFARDSLRLLAVAPNAEAIYFRATDDGLLDGADRLTADSLTFLFEGGGLREIHGVRGIEGTAYGPQIIPEPFRLSGYVYTPGARPRRAALLPPDGWEAAWLIAHPTADAGLPPPAEPHVQPTDAPHAYLASSAQPAPAQELPPYITGDFFDPDSVSIIEALTRALNLELARPAVALAIDLARESRDPAYIPLLKQHAELWGSGDPRPYIEPTVSVLDALWMLGEPEEYFYDLIPRWREDLTLAEAALYVVTRNPHSERMPEIEAIRAEVQVSDIPSIEKSVFGRYASEYRSRIGRIEEETAKPISEELDYLFYHLTSAASSGDWTDKGEYAIFSSGMDGAFGPLVRWSAARLGTLARTHPSTVQSFLDTLPGRDYFTDPAVENPAAQVAAFRALFEDLARLDEVSPPPPPDPDADVLPIFECAQPDTSGGLGTEGTYLAYFGYDNRHGQPVTISYGAENQITPATYDRQQSEVFFMPGVVPTRPGRTPRYGEEGFHGWTFSVRFQPGEEVTWTLAGRTTVPATDDPALRCGTYDPEPADLGALPAALTVATGPLTASFSGDAFSVSGLDHDAGGTPTASGDDRHALATETEAARTAVLGALAPNQHDNVEGTGGDADVAVEPVPFDLGALVDGLLATPALVVLGERPGNQSVGTLEAPVVAYAPDGLDAAQSLLDVP